MKKLLVMSMFVCLLVSTVFLPQKNAKAAPETINSKDPSEVFSKIYEETNNFKDVIPYSVPGDQNNSANRTVTKDKEKGTVTITLEKNGNREFISFNKAGKVFINGTEVPKAELMQQYTISPNASLTSGGRTWLTHYREYTSGYYQLKAYKEPTNYALDGGKGTPREAYGIPYSWKLADYRQLAKNVANARDNILVALGTISASGVGVAISWFTIVSLLVAAGPVAVAAYQVYTNSNSAKSDMLEAYNLIRQL